MNARLLAVAAGLVLIGASQAQYMAPGALPQLGPAPLLFVRFAGPDGMEATYYQGRARPHSFPAGSSVGLRPGYIYRVQLGGITDRPGVLLFPSIEVRGTLKLQPRHGAHNFPVTIPIHPEDVDAAVAGSMVTKVIYLENPDRAEPRATQQGEVIEYDVAKDRDIYNEARNRGRIMVVVHFGGRTPPPEELAATNVPGTILMPGERVIGPAWAPPCLGMVVPTARPPEEECLHDGGDRLMPAGFDARGQLGGVDPEDTVAEYRDSAGRRQIVCSNRVCLCVPRYVALRKECPLAVSEGYVGPEDRVQVKRGVTLIERKPSEWVKKVEYPKGYEGRLKPSLNLANEGPRLLTQLKIIQAQQLDVGPVELIGTKRIDELSEKKKAEVIKQLELVKLFSQVKTIAGVEQIVGTAVTARVKGLETITATVQTRDLTVCCHEAPIPPDRPLVLVKCADRSSARPGDVVTFTLRYSNVGGRPMTDVAVVDSLSGRLEYVPGSAQSDRDAVFTTQDNEAGSQVLRWEIGGTLLPGQSGRVRFQAKVR